MNELFVRLLNQQATVKRKSLSQLNRYTHFSIPPSYKLPLSLPLHFTGSNLPNQIGISRNSVLNFENQIEKFPDGHRLSVLRSRRCSVGLLRQFREAPPTFSRSLPGRKASLFVVRSDAGVSSGSYSRARRADQLITNAVALPFEVILFEHVLLYNLKDRIPDEEYVCNLEEAEMVRPGDHVSILTYSRMRYHVMQAAKTLVNKGYDPEVIDIRSLKSFDLHTIGNSVKKTHRVLIVEECMRTGGIGASLTAAITENIHDYLDAPIICLSSQDVPTPYAARLEEVTVVQPAQIVTVVEQLCQWVIAAA
ncbi:pyruvate dehydrogenase E1 component subunit beta-3 [Pyrus ussuriensis x Pyrus communis]|uniref:pyruvate dehydrogenase (acetyl-transferring) n=1 Tax=Pyrus ussuriensis x Pyrus communis TaxID=2448454 RepID=A0A5N5FJQ1_9ROSA|nr:pyruvate dehydrogenase E1 component subunit beta-3 [Pyrus ussuriensis x Pyrus communis]